MSKVKIYGGTKTRAARVIWCCKELGIDYELVELPMADLKKPEFLALNPNGKSPALVDGDVALFESMAINLYLAKKFGTGALYPANLGDEGRVLQWTLWGASEVEPNAMPSLLVALGYSTDAAGAAAAAEKLKAPIKVLDGVLKDREWLVGNAFSIADLNLSGCVGLARFGKIDLDYAPSVTAWLDRCFARPARN